MASSPKPPRSTLTTGTSNPNSRSQTPHPAQAPANDHAISFRHRLSQREYPPDCPLLNARWYYAVDVPKRKPFEQKGAPPANLPKPPSKFVPFGPRDSRAIEAAFQKLSEQEEADEISRALATDLPKAEDGVRVPVNEDYLFDIDIKNRELAPVYWEGPAYDVRRGTWFYQEGSSLRPCDENLATQIEDGYLNLKPFRTFPRQEGKGTKSANTNSVAPQKEKEATKGTTGKESVSNSASTHPTWRLFGAHLNSFVVFVDPGTAWLFTDDFYGKLTATVWQRMSAGTHMGGIKIVRGYTEPKSADKKGERPTTPIPTAAETPERGPESAISTSQPVEEDFRRASRDAGRIALERKMSTYSGDREAQEKMMESEIKEDYRDDEETDEPGREIEHLLLVTHGIGQKLSMKMESVNFVHDVNVFRKSLKGVYAVSSDLQVLNGEDGEGKRKNCRVQCLPVCWRHLLDFPKQSLMENRGEHDLSTKGPSLEEEYPSLDDITVEGAHYVRSLMTDLALDVLLYQSGTYREHIIRTVLTECNRIFHLFKKRNPGFEGKVSLVGHSLGSAIMFDILCRQPDDQPGPQRARNELPRLDFPVENVFCLGSPVGLFQMLKGRTIAARSIATMPAQSPLGAEYSSDPFSQAPGSSLFPVSSPKCAQLFNIFHPADPISYRMEPLVSKAMAQLKPQPLPYTKRGLFSASGQIVGGISGIGQTVTRSVANMWTSLSSGIASSILNRSLGISGDPGCTSTATTSAGTSDHKRASLVTAEGRHPPTMIDAEIETLYAGFQKRRGSAPGSEEQNKAYDQDEGRVLNEEEKVKALNRTGRIDFAIQEGVFDISVLASIASHLSYWGDEDVNHFIVSQLLSRSRVLRKSEAEGGWSIGNFGSP